MSRRRVIQFSTGDNGNTWTYVLFHTCLAIAETSVASFTIHPDKCHTSRTKDFHQRGEKTVIIHRESVNIYEVESQNYKAVEEMHESIGHYWALNVEDFASHLGIGTETLH